MFTIVSIILVIIAVIALIGIKIYKMQTEIKRLRQELKEKDAITKEAVNQAQYYANRDPLTGLYNKSFLVKSINNHIDNNIKSILVTVTADKIEDIRDKYGVQAFNNVILDLAKIITCSQNSDVIAYWPEYGISFIAENENLDQIKIKMQHIKEIISQHKFFFEDNIFNITVSIGIVAIPDNLNDALEVFDHMTCNLDVAMINGGNIIMA